MSPCNDFITYFLLTKLTYLRVYRYPSANVKCIGIYSASLNQSTEYMTTLSLAIIVITNMKYTTISQRLCKQLSLYHLTDISYHFISMIILIPILKGESRIYGLGVR